MMRRRSLLIPLAAASLLSACGFTLKRPPQLQVQRIQLLGFGSHSAMREEIARQLRADPRVTLVETAAQAQVVLRALVDRRERVAASATATGLISEMTLRVRLRFEVRSAAGQLLIPETELLLSRDMGYSESAAMAKEDEAEMLYRAMQGDIASQVLRRLASLPAN